MLVKALPPGVRLTAVFDCCHSGSALDLPYLYASTGYIRGSSALANLGHELVEGNFDAEAIKELQAKWQKLQAEEKEFARQVSLKAADADVIMFSGYVVFRLFVVVITRTINCAACWRRECISL